VEVLLKTTEKYQEMSFTWQSVTAPVSLQRVLALQPRSLSARASPMPSLYSLWSKTVYSKQHAILLPQLNYNRYVKLFRNLLNVLCWNCRVTPVFALVTENATFRKLKKYILSTRWITSLILSSSGRCSSGSSSSICFGTKSWNLEWTTYTKTQS